VLGMETRILSAESSVKDVTGPYVPSEARAAGGIAAAWGKPQDFKEGFYNDHPFIE